MNITSESNPSAATIAPVISAPTKAETANFIQSAGAYCDLSDAKAFSENFSIPHAPILCTFGGGRLHSCRLQGSWDLERMAADHPEALYRSLKRLPSQNALTDSRSWDDLTFQFGPRTFIFADTIRMVSFTSDPKEAEDLVLQFAAKYQKAACDKPEGGAFYLIQEESHGITTKKVTLAVETILKPDVFDLHYGEGYSTWHRGYLEKLASNGRGLSIFEGKPGTGKTSYVRHLMGELKETHRFYFIPSSALSILVRPDFVGFWADQRQYYEDKQFAVILEDSDTSLMTRGNDNRELVSALLNLSDGMLADFIRLQIICTINCSAADIDPAFLRPGRLICHRIFNRLDYSHAARLASHLGKTLPHGSDYSLAEVFAGASAVDTTPQRMGFAVNSNG